MTRSEKLMLMFALLCGVIALTIASAPVVQAVTGWRLLPLIMAMPQGDDPNCPPLAVNRGDDATWAVVCSTNQRQYPGSFLVIQTPNSKGIRTSAGTFNIGLIDWTAGHESTDFEYMGPCRGVNTRNGYNCGFAFDGASQAFYPTFGGDTALGQPNLPWGDAWITRLAVPYHKCADGSECMPVLFGGLPRYVKVTTD